MESCPDFSESAFLDLPEPPEDYLTSTRQVIKVPMSEGMWMDAGLPAIRKALATHPHTKHLDDDTMNKIACTMIYRFGKPEGETVEESVTSLFSPEELCALASDIAHEGEVGISSDPPEPSKEKSDKVAASLYESLKGNDDTDPSDGKMEVEVTVDEEQPSEGAGFGNFKMAHSTAHSTI